MSAALASDNWADKTVERFVRDSGNHKLLRAIDNPSGAERRVQRRSPDGVCVAVRGRLPGDGE